MHGGAHSTPKHLAPSETASLNPAPHSSVHYGHMRETLSFLNQHKTTYKKHSFVITPVFDVCVGLVLVIQIPFTSNALMQLHTKPC